MKLGQGRGILWYAPVFEIRSHAGQRLLQVCNDVFCILDTDGEAHQIWGDSGGGQLRIGASDTICRYFLVPYLNRFHRSFPNVHIKVTNQTSTQCVDLLESGQVDFIVTNYPNSHLSSRLHTIPIHSFHDIFIANGEYYPELENRPVHLKELLQYPILMLDRKSTTSEFLHSQFQRFQLDLVPEIELGSNDLLIDLASIGLGIAFVPDYCLVKETAAFQLDLVEELPPRQLVVAHSSHLPIPQAAKEFMSMLEKGAE